MSITFDPRRLTQSLTRSLGEETALRVLKHAMEEERLERVPNDPEQFAAFVHDAVLPRILPLMRLQEVHDLVRRTIGGEEGLHPASLQKATSVVLNIPAKSTAQSATKPRIVLLEPNVMRRVELSRACIRSDLDVELLDSPGQLIKTAPFHGAVVHIDEDSADALATLGPRAERAALVLLELNQRDLVRRLLHVWPNDRIAILPPDASPTTIVSRIRIVLA